MTDPAPGRRGLRGLGVAIAALILCLFALPIAAKMMGWLKPRIEMPLKNLYRQGGRTR